MYPRNAVTPPKIAVGAVVQISDGAVQTTGVSVAVAPEGETESAGQGAITYGASSGIVYYAPTQGETDYAAFVVTAYKAGCIPAAVTVVTTASATSGQVVVAANNDKSDYELSSAYEAAKTAAMAEVVDGITVASVLECLLAFMAGRATVVDNGDNRTITFYKRDGETAKLQLTAAELDGARAATGSIDPA